MKYFEMDPMGIRMLSRVEEFIPYHPALASKLLGAEIQGLMSELMGESAILFKEKINFKLPGGKGFPPHQDAPAFTPFGQNYHITGMISVDATTPENGCLELVRGRHREGMLSCEDDGSLTKSVVDALFWETVTTQPGDLLLFDSYVPHRSGPNLTQGPRRAYYITFNRLSEGDRRAKYYQDKRENFPTEIERLSAFLFESLREWSTEGATTEKDQDPDKNRDL